MKQGNRSNFLLSGYLMWNICSPNTFRCILVYVATSSDHQTTNSRHERHSLAVYRTLARRPASTTCHRAATNYCVAPPHISPKPPNCFQHVRPQYSSLYPLTSVYVTHIHTHTHNLQYSFLPTERPVRSVCTLHYLVVGCKFGFCTWRRASGKHFLLLLYAATCLLRNVTPAVFYAFFQDLSFHEFLLANSATKTGIVRGMCMVVAAFRPSCIHPLYVTVAYRNDA